MAIFPLIKELPERYHILTTVRSVELKVKLAERIGGILKLLEFFDVVQPEERTKLLVNGFFEYLHRTCDDSLMVNRRALWLSKYADVVYDHMLAVKHGPVMSRETVMADVDNEFTQDVGQLILAITDYHSQPIINTPINYPAYQIILNLSSLCERVKPDPRFSDYIVAHEEVKSLTMVMRRLIQTGAVLIDDENGFLEKQLRQIFYHTDRFVSHKGTQL
jgi:hypothetical protein